MKIEISKEPCHSERSDEVILSIAKNKESVYLYSTSTKRSSLSQG